MSNGHSRPNLANSLRLALVLPGLGRVARGAETAFLELARCWQHFQNISLTLIGSGDDWPDDLQSHVVRLTVPCRPREQFARWPRVPGFRSEYACEEFSFAWNLKRTHWTLLGQQDAVICCTYPHLNWLLQQRRRRGGPAQIYVTQNGDWPCQSNDWEFRWFDCQGLVCTNPEFFDRHQANYPSALIPNGVDPAVFHPNVDENDATAIGQWIRPFDNERQLVFLATALIESKRVDRVLSALELVPNAHVVIAGDGPQRSSLEKQAQAQLPGRYQFLGSVPRHVMPALYRRADALVHASQDEPFGIVYLESAASGLPLVVHGTPTTRWILGSCAQFVDTDHQESLAQAIKKSLQPDAKQRWGQPARQRVEHDWTWQRQADRYLEFIQARLTHESRHAIS